MDRTTIEILLGAGDGAVPDGELRELEEAYVVLLEWVGVATTCAARAGPVGRDE